MFENNPSNSSSDIAREVCENWPMAVIERPEAEEASINAKHRELIRLGKAGSYLDDELLNKRNRLTRTAEIIRDDLLWKKPAAHSRNFPPPAMVLPKDVFIENHDDIKRASGLVEMWDSSHRWHYVINGDEYYSLPTNGVIHRVIIFHGAIVKYQPLFTQEAFRFELFTLMTLCPFMEAWNKGALYSLSKIREKVSDLFGAKYPKPENVCFREVRTRFLDKNGLGVLCTTREGECFEAKISLAWGGIVKAHVSGPLKRL